MFHAEAPLRTPCLAPSRAVGGTVSYRVGKGKVMWLQHQTEAPRSCFSASKQETRPGGPPVPRAAEPGR